MKKWFMRRYLVIGHPMYECIPERQDGRIIYVQWGHDEDAALTYVSSLVEKEVFFCFFKTMECSEGTGWVTKGGLDASADRENETSFTS